MTSDSFFEQGNHAVCEDYTAHGPGYVIVCDGCSNGGFRIDSDFGARFLAKCATQHIGLLGSDLHGFVTRTLQNAIDCQRAVPGLNPECLTATLLAATDCGNAIEILAVGDGVWGGRRRDGTWDISTVNFQGSAPFYPRYLIANQQVDRYFQCFGGRFLRTNLRGNLQKLEAEEWESQINQVSPWFHQSYRKSEYDLVFIGSDGLGSFTEFVKSPTSKFGRQVPLSEVLAVLLDFPNFSSGYVERQCRWMFWRNLDGTFPRRGWKNSDDVSLAALYIG